MVIIISVSLVSTISAITFDGPRVSACLQDEVPKLTFLGHTKKVSLPSYAIIAQSLVAAILILINQFQFVIDLIFTLTLSTSLIVFGIFKLHKSFTSSVDGYKTWDTPLHPSYF
jgi:APA family basic amino acid/polyamine antiporter